MIFGCALDANLRLKRKANFGDSNSLCHFMKQDLLAWQLRSIQNNIGLKKGD